MNVLIQERLVADSVPGEMSSPDDYARLKRIVKDAGLLRKQPWYYAMSITANLAMLGICLVLMVLLRHSWLVLLDSVFLGLVSGQLGFQLHDAGHRQMFERGWKNTLVGFLTADALLGMSYGWWVSKHNRHHASPNHVDEDPDIGAGVIAYTPEQAQARRGPMRLLAAYQAYAFFPMLFLLGFAMHWSGITYLAGTRSRHRWSEIGVLAAHAVVYVGLMVLVLGPWMALAVIVIHKAIGGFYLASVFAPNHKGMPQVEGARPDFLRAQVLTARNVRAGAATDLWYGSLNYQIEHHLFPGMARNHVRAAHPIVREFCAEIGVDYYETSMAQSYRELLAFLHEIGRPLRGADVATA